MKKLESNMIGGLVLFILFLHIDAHSNSDQSNNLADENDSVTIKLNHSNYLRCGQPFFDSVYKLTKQIFIAGAENVVLSDFENQAFNFIRTTEYFEGNREAYIEQVKDIPAQIIEIVREDPEVLDSCENFSVAMVGPQ